MTSVQFCYWLQGFFELRRNEGEGIDQSQSASIKKHLAMVFIHEIDPSHGNAEHQAKLDAAHKPGVENVVAGFNPSSKVSFRC